MMKSFLATVALFAALAAATPATLWAQDEPPVAEAAVEEDLEATAQQLVRGLFNGEAANLHARFDETMKAALDTEKLGAISQQVVQAFGALQSFEDATSEPMTQQDVEFTLVRFPMQFERGRLEARVSFTVGAAPRPVSGLFFSPIATRPDQPDSLPPYAVPADLVEHNVQVSDLTGRLTLPKAASPENRVPAVILVHGSGPNDMDETMGALRPFRDLAMGLGTYGIAVLRYNKRTLERPETIMALERITLRDETDLDVHAGLKMLRERPEIDPDRVFILGHSLGGMLAPRIAAEDGKVAGVVVLAGPARFTLDSLRHQLNVVEGTRSDEERAASAETFAELRKAIDSLEDGTTPDDGEQIMGAAPYYWREVLAVDAIAAAKTLTVPVAILYAENDYQVLPSQAELWKPDFPRDERDLLKVFPGLSHLMMKGETGTPKDYQKLAHVEHEVVETIARFLKGDPKGD